MSRISALVLLAVTVFPIPTFAQSRGVEFQAGGGYVRDSGEGPSVPAVNAGMVAWLTSGWGVGVRVTQGVDDDHFEPPGVQDDRTFLGPGALRMWAVTSQWRGVSRGIEVNVGVGVGGHGSRYTQILTGIRHGDGRIDPISPQLLTERSGSGFIALDLLIGRHVAGPFHVKGGFTYGLAGDLHPFQPVVMLAWKP